MPDPHARPTPELSLVFADGQGQPTVFTIPEGTTTVGSAGDNDLVLEDAGVEPHQVVLSRAGDRLELRDLFAGETRVNDEPRRNGTIKPGDVLSLGRLKLRVMKVAPSISTQRLGRMRPSTRRLGSGGYARSGASPRPAAPASPEVVSDRAPTARPPTKRPAPPPAAPAAPVESDATARQARERDARRARALARARQVMDEVMVQDDFELILERLAEGFLDVFSADRAVSVLFEEDGRNPLLVVERLRTGTSDGAGVAQEIIDRCLQVRSVIRVAGGGEGLGGLAAPLITEGRALGLLYFERHAPGAQPLGADDVHLLAMLSCMAALKIAPLVL